MAKKKEKKETQARKAKVNTKLDGLEVNVDKFGEVQSNMDIDKINRFLDEEVEDKKLQKKRKK